MNIGKLYYLLKDLPDHYELRIKIKGSPDYDDLYVVMDQEVSSETSGNSPLVSLQSKELDHEVMLLRKEGDSRIYRSGN